ncbi:MAG TPA: YigZ family protein [Acholeplasmataceae bacterium]|nr:YigZ family protein [Acholeplasmataceae bacterium]
MYYLKERIEHKLVIERSEFITIIEPLESMDRIPKILKEVRKKYPKATHYCTAYIFENSQGSNDDGEPSGTAGVPMLEVLNKHELTNVFAVVVRYFGGIKLGAGGLIRAYAKSVAQALIDAPLLKQLLTHNFEVTFNYDQIGLIDRLFEGFIQDKTYLTNVTYTLSFTDNLNLIEEHQHLFKNMKEKGTKTILVPWK